MKKIILMMLLLLIGIIGCSKAKENNATEKKLDNQQNYESYELNLEKKLENIRKEVQPALDSGVTADMNDAISKQEEFLETEMKKVYELLETKLPDDKKTTLKKEQDEWAKKIKDEIEKSSEESEDGTISGVIGGNIWIEKTEERILELAKRYDKLNK